MIGWRLICHPLCAARETNQKSRLIKKKMTVTHSKESFEYLNHRHTKNKTPSSHQIKHNNYKRQAGKWNAERKHVFVIQPVVPETTAVGCCKYSWSLHNHGVIEVRTKRALIAREQSERNRLHTRVMPHNANAEEGAEGKNNILSTTVRYRSFSGNYLSSLSTVLITSTVCRRLFGAVK